MDARMQRDSGTPALLEFHHGLLQPPGPSLSHHLAALQMLPEVVQREGHAQRPPDAGQDP